ncbi:MULTISPECIES: AraC family transcriptional regulator [unclassified Lactococcus]|uniref:AraC family transcriptional regulator n=1 Tax=unclassified Lactococcus TaxID=2643510 RepID=UPI0011C9F3FF|nr:MULTISPECIES: AraC family transcriptional regulator [unclassified Lactococcus]MQW22349.1 helix-turn-helix domain-containing protein [Lactococcus sp. dk101]TXK45387.1 AraC family transcriptional regulator [Lactococcus sp. dk310]TXK51720.1 AraC family transcriptional regulator [Lactococcus sp. dk322]
MKEIIINDELEEVFEFPNPKFNFGLWEDNYSDFPEQTLECHYHDYYEIGYLEQGELQYYLNGNSVLLKAGDCIVLNSGTLHHAEAPRSNANNSIMKVMTFSSEIIVGDNNFLQEKFFSRMNELRVSGVKISRDDELGKQMTFHIKRIIKLNSDSLTYELGIISSLSAIWNIFLEYMSKNNSDIFYMTKEIMIQKEKNVKVLLNYIQNNMSEKITIETLCEYAGISRSDCFRSFQLFTNKVPMTYINDLKLKKAAKQLIVSNDSIKEIVNRFGLVNSSYFGVQFKKKYGESPLKYRKKMTKEIT